MTITVVIEVIIGLLYHLFIYSCIFSILSEKLAFNFICSTFDEMFGVNRDEFVN